MVSSLSLELSSRHLHATVAPPLRFTGFEQPAAFDWGQVPDGRERRRVDEAGYPKYVDKQLRKQSNCTNKNGQKTLAKPCGCYLNTTYMYALENTATGRFWVPGFVHTSELF